MGVCCSSICNNNDKTLSEALFSEDNDNKEKSINTPKIQNNNHSTIEEKQNNILESNQQPKLWGQQKDTLINTNINNIQLDKPDVIDEIFLDNNKLENSISMSIMEETEYGLNLLKMERNLFDLINELRSNPKSFINEIEKYKNQLKNENDKYYIVIDDNEFEFENGEQDFNE